MNAKEFISVNLNEVENEKKRIEHLLLQLPKASEVAKAHLTNELLGIVERSNEQLLSRLQAVTVLGSEAGSLGIKGSLAIAESLTQVLQGEFLPPTTVVNYGKDSIPIIRLKSLNELELWFLQALVTAIAKIEFSVGIKPFEELAVIMQGTQTADWLKKVFEHYAEDRSEKGPKKRLGGA